MEPFVFEIFLWRWPLEMETLRWFDWGGPPGHTDPRGRWRPTTRSIEWFDWSKPIESWRKSPPTSTRNFVWNLAAQCTSRLGALTYPPDAIQDHCRRVEWRVLRDFGEPTQQTPARRGRRSIWCSRCPSSFDRIVDRVGWWVPTCCPVDCGVGWILVDGPRSVSWRGPKFARRAHKTPTNPLGCLGWWCAPPLESRWWTPSWWCDLVAAWN